jgi:putative FmdB family regulatory protein
MPIYEYSCLRCGAEFEKLVSMHASPSCPACASDRVMRRISLVGVRTAGGTSAESGPVAGGGCCGGGCGCH